jgi:hypothetical protein
MNEHSNTTSYSVWQRIKKMSWRVLLVLGILFGLMSGIIIGGYLFADTKPRSIIALHRCADRCYKPNEIAGLLLSVGLQKLNITGLKPVFESDKLLVVNHPEANTPFHEVIIPKKDIRDIADVSSEDAEYVMEVFGYISQRVKEKKLVRYKVVTNGPGYQNLAYLHFHLIGR